MQTVIITNQVEKKLEHQSRNSNVQVLISQYVNAPGGI